MYSIFQEMDRSGLQQEFYAFNTGGVGADSNEEASGQSYKKIPRELTLMLQEALLREAVKFEYDPALGSDIGVAVVNQRGKEVVDLRPEWLPTGIYGEEEYTRRILELSRRRYYSRDPEDKAGILRYTKVIDDIIELDDIPPPGNERELAWLLSFFWHVDQAYSSLSVLVQHRSEGRRPGPDLLRAIQDKYEAGLSQGLELPPDSLRALEELGLRSAG
jgi:hypothetical protein